MQDYVSWCTGDLAIDGWYRHLACQENYTK
jgi:hypothetical protein